MIKFDIDKNPGAPVQDDSNTKDLKERIKELEFLSKTHQRLNGELQIKIKELEADNKRLAKEVDDRINLLRGNGGLW